MTIRRNSIISILLTVALTAVFFTFGCEEHDVFTISQEEELERYYADSEICQELFRSHDLTLGASYTLPDNDTVYTDIIDNSTRSSTTIIDPNKLIDLEYGTYYYGEIVVEDILTGRTQKQVNQV